MVKMFLMSLANCFFVLVEIVQLSTAQAVPRTSSTYQNATTARSSSTSAITTGLPTCCYLYALGVGNDIWWTGSVEVVVATVSTVIYQYDNTAITSYKTTNVNATRYPTNNVEFTTISGIPTDLVGEGAGGYPQLTTFVYSRYLTDKIGHVFHSPTDVWEFNDVTYYTQEPTPTGASYACPSNSDMFGHEQRTISPYPSTFMFAGNGSEYQKGELFLQVPEVVRAYLIANPDPGDPDRPDLTDCQLGLGNGIPVAHIPVAELTAEAEAVTSTVGGYYGTPTPDPPTPNPNPPTPTPPNPNPPNPDPPVQNPPTQNLPTQNLPTQNLPTQNPPTQNPPTQIPPTQNPPTQNLPTQTPPAQNQPVYNPPTQDPPTQNPPTQNPPAQNQPVYNPPNQDPPTQNPPSQNPPAQNQPVYNPPTQEPSYQNPPAQNAPNSNPPAQEPGPPSLPSSDTPVDSQIPGNPTGVQNPASVQNPAVNVGITVAAPATNSISNPSPTAIATDQTLVQAATPLAPPAVAPPSSVYTPLTSPAPILPSLIQETVFTYFVMGGSTYTQTSAGDIVLGTQTLTPGGVVTISGQTISLTSKSVTQSSENGGVGGAILTQGGYGTGVPAPLNYTGPQAAGGRLGAQIDVRILVGSLGMGIWLGWIVT